MRTIALRKLFGAVLPLTDAAHSDNLVIVGQPCAQPMTAKA
jgi:hypothetical protein